MSEKLPSGIDRLPSGKYRARVRGKGSRTFTQRRDAETWIYEKRIEKETGRETVKPISLADLAAEHIMVRRAEGLADNTLKTYKAVWRAHVFGHPIANRKITEIAPQVIEQWRDERLSAGAGRQSIRTAMVVMQA